MKTAKKLVTLTIVAFVSGLSAGQFAAADVSKEALKYESRHICSYAHCH